MNHISDHICLQSIMHEKTYPQTEHLWGWRRPIEESIGCQETLLVPDLLDDIDHCRYLHDREHDM